MRNENDLHYSWFSDIKGLFRQFLKEAANLDLSIKMALKGQLYHRPRAGHQSLPFFGHRERIERGERGFVRGGKKTKYH